MNDSNRRVLTTVLIIVAVGGTLLYLGNSYFWKPYREAKTKLETLQDEVAMKEREDMVYKAEKARLSKWNDLSLPANPDKAASEYSKMLKPLLRECGLTVEDFQGPPPQESSTTLAIQKKPKHIILPFQVRAKGTVESLTKTLETLERIPVAHRVKTLVVDRVDAKDRTGKVSVQMTIEAMIVAGAKNEPKLSASSLGPAQTSRKYSEVALRNPFVGALPAPPPPKKVVEVVEVEPEPPAGPDVLEFIRIDTIVPTSNEAFLRNILHKSAPLRLRSTPRSGYDTFSIRNEDRSKVLLKGKVLRIDPRDIYFQKGEDVYRFHFGQSLADAIGRPLSKTELKDLELVSLIDPEFAREEMEASKKAESKTKTTSKKGR